MRQVDVPSHLAAVLLVAGGAAAHPVPGGPDRPAGDVDVRRGYRDGPGQGIAERVFIALSPFETAQVVEERL